MKLNLHAHTTFSDGEHTVWSLAKALKERGHRTICITDHDYHMTADKFLNQLQVAKETMQDLKEIYIICGLEVCTLYEQEILLFGNQAVLNFLYYREEIERIGKPQQILFTPEFKRKHLKDIPHAVVLNHPHFSNATSDEVLKDFDFFSMFDGWELISSGQRKDNWPWQKVMANKKQFTNMDIHKDEHLNYPCNEVDDVFIKDDLELVRWIKS